MESIGGSLRTAREKRKLSVEEIEFETHIRAELLRDLEGDEYSNFPNLTYARSFLAKYSDFLGVDTLAFQEEFAKPELASVDDYTYLQEPTEVLRGGGLGRGAKKPEGKGGKGANGSRQGQRREERERRPIEQPAVGRPHPILLGALMVALLGGAYYLFQWGKERARAGETPSEKTSPATVEGGEGTPPPGGDPIPAPETAGNSAGTPTPPAPAPPRGPSGPGGSIIGPPAMRATNPPAGSPRRIVPATEAMLPAGSEAPRPTPAEILGTGEEPPPEAPPAPDLPSEIDEEGEPILRAIPLGSG